MVFSSGIWLVRRLDSSTRLVTPRVTSLSLKALTVIGATAVAATEGAAPFTIFGRLGALLAVLTVAIEDALDDCGGCEAPSAGAGACEGVALGG